MQNRKAFEMVVNGPLTTGIGVASVIAIWWSPWREDQILEYGCRSVDEHSSPLGQVYCAFRRTVSNAQQLESIGWVRGLPNLATMIFVNVAYEFAIFPDDDRNASLERTSR
jgi:hypothetical protein